MFLLNEICFCFQLRTLWLHLSRCTYKGVHAGSGCVSMSVYAKYGFFCFELRGQMRGRGLMPLRFLLRFLSY